MSESLLSALIERTGPLLAPQLAHVIKSNLVQLTGNASWNLFLGRWYGSSLGCDRAKLHTHVLELLLNSVHRIGDFELPLNLDAPEVITIDSYLVRLSGRTQLTWARPQLTIVDDELIRRFVVDSSSIKLSAQCSAAANNISIYETADYLTVACTRLNNFDLSDITKPSSASLNEIKQAQRLIRNDTPYGDWVGCAIKRIHLIPRRSKEFISGSSRFEIGSIWLSSDATLFQIAESLVHEAAHQFFYFAKALGPLVCDDDIQLYSPLKGTNRSLENIFLAWHAMANVVNFYGHITSKGHDTRAARGASDAAANDFQILDDHLSQGTYLTPLGLDLFRPIRRQAVAMLNSSDRVGLPLV